MKDDLHFYLMLGLLPMAALITYVNIFVGPAELSDIPEGYEPKEWEYHRSPIKRWFANYIYEEPQKEYEKTLYWIHYWSEKKYWNNLGRKVKQLMENRLDYKGWYWVNADQMSGAVIIISPDKSSFTLDKSSVHTGQIFQMTLTSQSPP
ncbi:NADH dehydrogenase [ubiquinone] 1 beta subcomplex subunit 5 mitochondrial [Biomphalaria pfeifferi]|uniref:NADH dehydrogenase [ubiquinone] 1 beta subcomplex subunit 5, mitochondrial n=1 Tax=Biomphalaria pfeifferi TaxID=112525 RepID=A0AAD8FFW4_BIOPF|nr:NADH dehydrogenase [ubiquinone] 1 beta subcomplex subunit 5 mitochondrial [Biomphalaria pfeifferi]